MNGTTTRRTFFGGAAALAAGAAVAREQTGEDLNARLSALEDANAIRTLLQDYAQHVNSGLQAAPAAHVRSMTLDANVVIDVTANGKATVRAPCTVETATPIDGHETVVEMARLQGDGVITRSEHRVLAGTLVKHNGIWILEQTELTA
jgi:hypothetical protein